MSPHKWWDLVKFGIRWAQTVFSNGLVFWTFHPWYNIMPPLCHHYAIRLVGRSGIFRSVARNADPSIRRWIFNEVPFVSDKLQNMSRLVDSKTAAWLFKTIKLLFVPLIQRRWINVMFMQHPKKSFKKWTNSHYVITEIFSDVVRW